MRLDCNDEFPSGMKEYLNHYGWHFSKKMCDWATHKMYKMVNGKKTHIIPITREQLNVLCSNYNVELEEPKGYDDVYVANMCKSDFLGSSIPNDQMLVHYVKDVLCDDDSYEGMPFTRFYADCIGSGTPIIWEEML